MFGEEVILDLPQAVAVLILVIGDVHRDLAEGLAVLGHAIGLGNPLRSLGRLGEQFEGHLGLVGVFLGQLQLRRDPRLLVESDFFLFPLGIAQHHRGLLFRFRRGLRFRDFHRFQGLQGSGASAQAAILAFDEDFGLGFGRGGARGFEGIQIHIAQAPELEDWKR